MWISVKTLRNFSDCAYEHYSNQVYLLQLCGISKKDIDSYKLHLRYADNETVTSINGTIILLLQRNGNIFIFLVPGFCKKNFLLFYPH